MKFQRNLSLGVTFQEMIRTRRDGSIWSLYMLLVPATDPRLKSTTRKGCVRHRYVVAGGNRVVSSKSARFPIELSKRRSELLNPTSPTNMSSPRDAQVR
jgi:hypothetical protein